MKQLNESINIIEYQIFLIEFDIDGITKMGKYMHTPLISKTPNKKNMIMCQLNHGNNIFIIKTSN